MSRSIDLNIQLKPKQQKLYNLFNGKQFLEFLLYGASRSGKTFVILYWMIVQCVAFGANCLILRALLTSLQTGMLNQTLPAVLESFAKHNGYDHIDHIIMANGKPFCVFNGKHNTLTFFNGKYIQFASLRGSADSASTYDKILSTEWGHIFVDEVSEIDEQAIDVLRSRLAQLIDGMTNKMIFALNPTSKLHWTYIRFFKHQKQNGEPIDVEIYDTFFVQHFAISDNKGNISASYERSLQNMSKGQQKRFLSGEYADESEGEVFKEIAWGERPESADFKAVIIYTDPSAKDQKTNDYKASVMLGLAHNKIWLLDARAVQGNSYQMMENIYDLWQSAPVTPRLYIENRQLPLDFEKTFQKFQDDRSWPVVLEKDNRNHGDKFTNIESTLEPLFRHKRFIFCQEMKKSGVLEITIDQFIRFSRKIQRDRKDDIPDACAKGTSILMRQIEMPNIQEKGNNFLVRRGVLTDF